MAKRAPAGNGGKPPGRMIKPSHKDVEILATLLVNTSDPRVTFDPKKALNMAFLCRGPIGKRARDSICKSYLESLSVYHDIVGNRASVKECSWEKMDDFYSFVAERDVASLTPANSI